MCYHHYKKWIYIVIITLLIFSKGNIILGWFGLVWIGTEKSYLMEKMVNPPFWRQRNQFYGFLMQNN